MSSSGATYQPGTATTAAPVVQPSPDAVRELAGLRHRELQVISDRLGRMSRRQYDRMWGALAILFYGGVLGGGIGLVPFLSTRPHNRVKTEYFVLLGIAFLFATLCLVARLTVKSERDDSCEAIKHDLDTILGAYPPPAQAAVRGPAPSQTASSTKPKKPHWWRRERVSATP